MSEWTTAGEGQDASGPQKRRIRNYLIDSSIQLRLASYLVAVACAISIGMGWLLWNAYRESSRLVSLGDPKVDDALATMLAREDRERMLWLGIGLVAVILCLLIVAVIVTHRVAGPTVALSHTCRRVGAGDLSRPRPLRRHDLLVDLADEIALMVDGLRKREAEERTILVEAVERLRRGASPAEQEVAVWLEDLASRKGARLSQGA
ncbi:MAG TPA: hypothetical protein VMK42_09400 [Anaeromyxobacteraceae bacterium]|nr:hypothetical protein [Anaeromyxobacteraceae bacterium]